MKAVPVACCAVALAGSLFTAAPASAEITYAGCENETYSKAVKFKGKFAYSISQMAIACAEHISGPAGACQLLSSYDPRPSFVEIKVGRNVRSAGTWSAGTPVEQPRMTSCETASTARGAPYATVQYKAAFLWEHNHKMYIARPGLQVRFNAMTTTDAAIVSFKLTGRWGFKKFNPKNA